MFDLDNKFYTAALRWKKGEMEALGHLDGPSKERLLPHLVFPPLRARDLEANRVLSQDEFSLVQVGYLTKYWYGRPCLADFRFLDFPDDDRERFDELLARSRQFGCKLIPVVDFRVDQPRREVTAAHIRQLNCGGAIRIGLSDLNEELEEKLNALTTDWIRRFDRRYPSTTDSNGHRPVASLRNSHLLGCSR